MRIKSVAERQTGQAPASKVISRTSKLGLSPEPALTISKATTN